MTNTAIDAYIEHLMWDGFDIQEISKLVAENFYLELGQASEITRQVVFRDALRVSAKTSEVAVQ